MSIGWKKDPGVDLAMAELAAHTLEQLQKGGYYMYAQVARLYRHTTEPLTTEAMRHLPHLSIVVVTREDTRAWRLRRSASWPGFPDDIHAIDLDALMRSAKVTLHALPDEPRRPSWLVERADVVRYRSFLQPGYEKPGAWGTEEYKRGSHLAECPVCGKEYRKHPAEQGPGYGFAGDERIELLRGCDGSLIKP